MNISHIPRRDAERLKIASAKLVEQVGGVVAAGRICGCPHNKISDAISHFHDDKWLSLKRVAELEAEAEDPIVTEALADMLGMALSPREPVKPKAPHEHLVTIITTTGDVESGLAGALKDGRLDQSEIATLDRDCSLAILALQQLQAQLRHTRGNAT
jgi:hypothetical protein